MGKRLLLADYSDDNCIYLAKEEGYWYIIAVIDGEISHHELSTNDCHAAIDYYQAILADMEGENDEHGNTLNPVTE